MTIRSEYLRAKTKSTDRASVRNGSRAFCLRFQHESVSRDFVNLFMGSFVVNSNLSGHLKLTAKLTNGDPGLREIASQ